MILILSPGVSRLTIWQQIDGEEKIYVRKAS
jgi:hypothetical protein